MFKLLLRGVILAFAVVGPAAAQSLPTTKAECFNGDWKAFLVFKNQGDCVSFVATKGKNQPALGTPPAPPPDPTAPLPPPPPSPS